MSDTQSRITKCWNGASASYDATPGHGLMSEAERDAWQRVLRDVLPPAPADVLDVGTGTGFLAFRAHELGYHVTGVDLSEEMLAVARRTAEGMDEAPAFLTGDAMTPPLPPASFDAVTNRHLLWTLTDPEAALRSWHALLRPGGTLVVIDGIWPKDGDAHDDDDDGDGHTSDDNAYTPELLAQLPMTRAESVGDVIRVIQAAAFRDVREIDLAPIDEAEGHLDSVKGRYGIVARS
jgi:SAM-dependent methyltransferase